MNKVTTKTVYTWLSLLLLFIGQIAPLGGLRVSAADSGDYSYEAYVKPTEYADYSNPIYVRDAATSEERVVYCFNYHSEWPNNEGTTPYPKYKKELGNANTFAELAASESLTGADLEATILKVIYNGFGNDAARLQAKYGLSNGVFRRVTQYAIWYFTDHKDFPSADVSPITSFTAKEKAVFMALIGQGDALETPPVNATLDVYRTDGSKPNNGSSKANYQNLLGGNFVNKDTGTDVPVVKKKISIFAKKVWDKADNVANKPEVSFQLKNKQTGEAIGDAKVVQTPAGRSEATVQWDDLSGEVSDYTVEEVTKLDGYTTSPTQGNGTETSPFTITNTKNSTVPEYVQTIQVNKAWAGENLPAAKPDVYFALYKRTNGVESQVTAADVPAIKVNPQKWQVSPVVWKNIYAPGRDQATGATIEYFVKEVNADGSDWSAPNYLAPTSTSALSGANSLVFNFTNTYQPTSPKPTTHDVVISKTNLGGKEIAGAQIEIRKDGQKVEGWTSEADKSHTVKLEAGEYVFHEEVAPTGYLKVTDITFTVDKDGKVTVKTDTTTAEKSKTEGSKLTVVDETQTVSINLLKLWSDRTGDAKTTDIPEQVTVKLYANGKPATDLAGKDVSTVVLTKATANAIENTAVVSNLRAFDETGNRIVYTIEETPVAGYTEVGEAAFKTSATPSNWADNGAIYNLTLRNQENTVEKKDVVISKTNLGGKEIAGAQIEIRKDGQKVEGWTSEADKSHTVKLEAGEYVFHEEVAPTGYLKVTDITFTVDKDGNVTVKEDTTTAEKSKTEGNKLTVVDETEVVKPTTHDVVISKTNLGGKEIAGAQIEIRKDGQKVEGWTSEADKSHIVKLEAGEYVFHEEVAPTGYLKVTDITFTVDKDGNVTVKEDTTTAEKSKTEDNKLTVVDEAEAVKPEPQPVEPKPTPTPKEDVPKQNGGTNTTTTKKVLPRTNSENAIILTMVGFGLLVVLGFSYWKKVNE
ncbi:TQXA domain-containing protein/LPXTG-motif cell wall-anchored protein [Streptococcus gallinaceus]|uniref:SpaA isopeptide-forming pilin-related protein n=1 Tax=Streptococcus gallinaceus TaxID=165758 RepID=UPI0020A1F907|nr:SpaA isopeptide-forming pilin-related protein [Streptococcus gallinaceus]MCP1638750.1 TQXA domain-containing protein/LPXTG-motif cell wall-anchored protein [Streptococcus gallinaceus]MCP1769163.1 TQXA domain-containing protein/LPXTG-motif cell wall-anchored protein [Streptococcus gallinaceus]